jgi:hypothetical protein
MTNPQPHPSPTDRQLRFLEDLAKRKGETFTYPHTRAEASREIKRLLGRRSSGAAERRREIQALREEMTRLRGDAAAVRPDELGGYGASATWDAGLAS